MPPMFLLDVWLALALLLSAWASQAWYADHARDVTRLTTSACAPHVCSHLCPAHPGRRHTEGRRDE